MENSIDKKDINIIHIALAIDEKYVIHCLTTMASILSNTSSSVHFHILAQNLSDKSKKRLKLLNFDYAVSFYDISKIDLSYLPLNREHISVATYYRLLLSYFVKVNKLIYLDCDIIVLDDIANLWNIDCSNVALCAIKDEADFYHSNRLNLQKYFNAGILLINMKKYRKKTLEDFVFIMNKYNKKIECQDQDILNIAFKDNVKFIDLRWNTNAVLYYNDIFSDSTITLKESYIAKDSPAILHYTGPSKPWQFTNNHPRKLEYLRYLLLTKCYKNIVIQILLFLLSLIIKIDITYKEKTLKLFTLKIFSIYSKNTKKVILFNRISLPLIRR